MKPTRVRKRSQLFNVLLGDKSRPDIDTLDKDGFHDSRLFNLAMRDDEISYPSGV